MGAFISMLLSGNGMYQERCDRTATTVVKWSLEQPIKYGVRGVILHPFIWSRGGDKEIGRGLVLVVMVFSYICPPP